jgi:exodeoxyribonuclease VII large subunit
VILQDGQQVEVHGDLTVYEAGGQYQLIADVIRIAGEGLLFQEFLRRKATLEAEGWFDPERKKMLPERSYHIGVVTSPTGAAFQDICNTIARRFPLAEIWLSPALVQGDAAPASILKAFQLLLRSSVHPDVIILTRGGGSLEDLWAFNDAELVRQVAQSPIPVVTGVGHETDFTLVDFASDVRAPTPTAAAELVTPNQWNLRAYTGGLILKMQKACQEFVQDNQHDFQALRHQLERRSPLNQIQSGRMLVENVTYRIEQTTRYQIQGRRIRLQGLTATLTASNPLGILDRGYSLVLDASGTLVRSVHQVRQGDKLDVRVSDGAFRVETI